MSAQRFIVRVEGEEFEVELRTEGDQTIALIGEQRYVLRASSVHGVTVRAADAHTHHTVILDGLRRPEQVSIAGQALDVEVETAQEAALARALSRRGGGHGAGDVTSPMPGRVVRATVAEGDEVTAGQPIIIVEAMKMENELQAPVAGVVGRLHVSAGDTVDAGALLCTIEPHDDASPTG